MRTLRAIILMSVTLLMFAPLAAGGSAEAVTVSSAGAEDFAVTVVPGEHYRHTMPLFLFVRLKNPPQMALWAETPDGEFIDTLMVTEKGGTMKWRKAPGDDVPEGGIRRPGALPVWTARSGRADVGAPVVVDAVSQATPKGGFSVKGQTFAGHDGFYLYFEVNHSTDFNSAYPAEAEPGSFNYNGGEWGSGQPALVYRAYVNQIRPETSDTEFELIGHSSPSGADGRIYADLSGIDSALKILQAIRMEMVP
jgi:hypothetical protein